MARKYFTLFVLLFASVVFAQDIQDPGQAGAVQVPPPDAVYVNTFKGGDNLLFPMDGNPQPPSQGNNPMFNVPSVSNFTFYQGNGWSAVGFPPRRDAGWESGYGVIGSDATRELQNANKAWEQFGALVMMTAGDIFNVPLSKWQPIEYEIRDMLGTPVGKLGWDWGSLWGKHFVLDLLKMSKADTELGGLSRAALNQYRLSGGDLTIQEIIHNQVTLREHFEWVAEVEDAKSAGSGERYRRGVSSHPDYANTLNKEWYRHNGLPYGRMIGED